MEVKDLLKKWFNKNNNIGIIEDTNNLNLEKKRFDREVLDIEIAEEKLKVSEEILKKLEESVSSNKAVVSNSFLFPDPSSKSDYIYFIEDKKILISLISSPELYFFIFNPYIQIALIGERLHTNLISNIINLFFEGQELGKKIWGQKLKTYVLNLEISEIISNFRNVNLSVDPKDFLNEESEMELEDVPKEDLSIDNVYDEIHCYYFNKHVEYYNGNEIIIKKTRDLTNKELNELYFARRYKSSSFLDLPSIKPNENQVFRGRVFEGKCGFPFMRNLIKCNRYFSDGISDEDLVRIAHLITINGPKSQWPERYKEKFELVQKELNK